MGFAPESQLATAIDNLTLQRLGLPPGFVPNDPSAALNLGMSVSGAPNMSAATPSPPLSPSPSPPPPAPKMLSQDQQTATTLGLPPGFTPDPSSLKDIQQNSILPGGQPLTSTPKPIPMVTTQPLGKPGAPPDFTTLGLDPDYLTRIISIESPTGQDNPTSGAAGPLQFMPAAGWKPGQPWTPGPAAQEAGVTNPHDPQQVQSGGYKLTQLLVQRLTSYFGRPPTSAEVYLAHQQGAEGATSSWPIRAPRPWIRSAVLPSWAMAARPT